MQRLVTKNFDNSKMHGTNVKKCGNVKYVKNVKKKPPINVTLLLSYISLFVLVRTQCPVMAGVDEPNRVASIIFDCINEWYTPPRRYHYFDVVELVRSHDPESYAGDSVCYW